MSEVRVEDLIFEPDGLMLQLPPYLLVASQPGVDAYRNASPSPAAMSLISPVSIGLAGARGRFRSARADSSTSARLPLRTRQSPTLGLAGMQFRRHDP